MSRQDSTPKPRRRRRRLAAGALRVVAWTAVAAALGLALLMAFVNSELGRERGRSLVAARLSEYLGRSVTVGDFDLDLLPLSVTAYDLVVPGRTPDEPPLAKVGEVEVQVELSGIRQPRLHIRQVFLRGPELELILDADGSTNLPELQRSGGGGQMEVTLGSLVVREGMVHFADRSLPLDLDARALWLRAGGRGANEDLQLETSLASPEVTLVLPDAVPYTGSVRGQATVGSGEVVLSAVHWASPELTSRADGRIVWDDASREVRLQVTADARAELLGELGYSEQPIAGSLRLDGELVAFGGPAVEAGPGGEPPWSFTGTVRSDQILVGEVAERELAVRGLETSLRVDPNGVRADVERAAYAGGGLSGVIGVPAGVEPARVEVDLRLDRLAVPELAADWGVDLAGVSGGLSGQAEYRFETARPAAGSGELRLRIGPEATAAAATGPAATGPAQTATELPLRGSARLQIQAGRLRTDDVLVEAPGQRLTAGGELDLESGAGRLAYDLATDDLAPLVRAFAPPADEPAAFELIGGRGTVTGEVTLAAAGAAVDAELDLTAVQGTGVTLDRLEGGLGWQGDSLRLSELRARRLDGELTAAGSLPLPGEASAGLIDLTVDLAGWPAAELAGLLPDGSPELAGAMTGRVTLGGSWDSPAATAELAAAPFAISGLATERSEVTARWTPEALQVDSLRLTLPAGEVSGGGTLGLAPGSERLDLELLAEELDLATPPLAGLLPGPVAGRVSAEVAATGSLADPALELKLTARGLQVAGRALGEAGRAALEASWRDGELRADGSLLGLLSLSGGGRLEVPLSDAAAAAGASDLALRVASDDLNGLLRAAGVGLDGSLPGAADLTGSLDGTLFVRGDPLVAEELEVRLVLDSLVASLDRDTRLANLEPVVTTWVEGLLDIESFYVGNEAGDELFVAGGVDLAEEGVPLDLKFQGQIDTAWAEPLIEGCELSGSLFVLGSLRGDAANPRLNGQGAIEGGKAIFAGFPHAFDAVDATLFFNPDGTVILDRLSAELAGGSVRAQGELQLPPPGSGAAVDYRFQTQARRFGLRWPEGFLLRGDADVTISGSEGEQQIVGSVDLERAFYLEDVSLKVTEILREALHRRRLEAGAADESLTATQINVAINGPLRVRNNLADLRGDIDLLIRGNLARPAVFGQVAIDPGGELTYSGNEYRVERGLLTFSNPYRIDPVFDLVATSEIDRYDITLQLAGTLERLDASFSSDPPLADLEVLQIVATGSAPSDETAAASAAADEGGGAAALIYGQAASVVSDRVSDLFGFDRFQVNPGIGGDLGFAVGKRLSKDLYVTVSNDPVNDIDYLVQAEWRLSDTMTVVLTQRGDQYAVDLRWENRF